MGITRFSYGYCVGMALKLLLGTLPWASVLLFISLVHLYFPVFRVLRYVKNKIVSMRNGISIQIGLSETRLQGAQ